ncbi:site-2 protease family protein [Synechococcus sp. PCC 7336]|uniref:site-2 protease family protein n=1 Tax=Synechococcus sp. PCC 7336 TaxID=195250 RepID=UPI00034AA73B|nr:site-2 protease family protein [Synechococcus sp. PCC 7336]
MQGFRLGSIWGFEVRIDASWFVIFFLILWTLSAGAFPTQFPELSAGTHLAMGLAGTLLFFVSLVLHELSHSLVARSKGIPIEGITLFIFGGVARISREAKTPGDEFQIAVVGPLASFAIALCSGLTAWVGGMAGWSIAVTGVANYLAYINLALGIFNLLPGFPLDGGRLFRAIVWKWTGNQTRATQIASSSGKALGFAIVFLGVLLLLRGLIFNGLWFVLMGMFLQNSAEAGYQQQLLQVGLAGVQAWEVMTRHPETVPHDLSLQQLVDEYFLHRRHHSFPVLRGGHPCGIVTLNQVKQVPREQWQRLTVGDIMKPLDRTVVVRPEEKILDTLKRMDESQVGRVLVILDGALEGIISARDIADWLRQTGDLSDLQHRF